MKTTIAIILIMLMPFMFNTREHLVIQGQVSDKETQDALVNCHVYVKDRSAGTLTDANGNFSITVPAGYKNNSLYVSHIGYGKYKGTISRISGKQLKIRLTSEPIMLEGITIRPEDTRSETALTASFDPEK